MSCPHYKNGVRWPSNYCLPNKFQKALPVSPQDPTVECRLQAAPPGPAPPSVSVLLLPYPGAICASGPQKTSDHRSKRWSLSIWRAHCKVAGLSCSKTALNTEISKADCKVAELSYFKADATFTTDTHPFLQSAECSHNRNRKGLPR